MTQLPWNPPGVLSRLVDPDTDLGPPLGYLLHGERIADPPDQKRGFAVTLGDWPRIGMVDGVPYLAYWEHVQWLVCQAMDCPAGDLVWWVTPIFDPNYQPGSDDE